MKKVLFILPSTVGGAERVTVTVSRMLPESNYSVKYAVVSHTMGEITSILPADAQVKHIKISNIWDFTTLRLWRLLRNEKPDYVFSSLRYLNIRVLAAARLSGVKAIVRNDNGLQTCRWDNRLFMRLTYPWAHAVVAQQEEMRQELIDVMHLDGNKVKVICNPLDTATIDRLSREPSPYPDTNEVKYLWTARFFYNKGQDLICRAFAHIHSAHPNTHLYLLGRYSEDSPYYLKVRQYVRDNNLENAVTFAGHQENPYNWMAHCDCFVMPSRYEGMPNSLMEAMYLRRPVVATRCIPLISRMVDDGHNGILVDCDDEKQMATAMVSALHLTDCHPSYATGQADDFIKLFES